MTHTLNHLKNEQFGRQHQKGAATLLITMVLLFGVTLVSLNSSKLSVLELIMSDNFESRHIAFNEAESGLDALYSLSENIIDLNDPPGRSYCTAPHANLSNCDEFTITSTIGWPSSELDSHEAQLVFEKMACAPRSLDTGCAHVLFAHYALRSVFDDTANKRGTSESVAGAMELLPKF